MTNADSSGDTGDHSRFSWAEYDQPSTGIVEAVAAATGSDATDLPQLGHAVDPDALNDLMTDEHEDATAGVHVTFSYADVAVSVDSDGGILIDESR